MNPTTRQLLRPAFAARAFTLFGITAIVVSGSWGCSSTAATDTVSAVYKTDFVKATAGARNSGGKPLTSGSATGQSSSGLHFTDAANLCDVCANGVDNCGQPCGGSATIQTQCGDPGACPCSSGQNSLIGYCGSRSADEVCTYCPPLTTLDDPCGTLCKLDENAAKPPDVVEVCGGNYPVECQASCCPSDHPACCPNIAYCGASSTDCESGDASSGGGGGGGSGFSCDATNSQVSCAPLTSCKTCSLRSCGGPDGSGCAFYLASDGAVFGGSATELMAAAQQALAHCGCL